jgi:4-oxalocrotonate tautomerase
MEAGVERLGQKASGKRRKFMPFINVQLARELIADDPAAKKLALGRKITEAVASVTGVKSEEVWIVIDEVPARDWFVGGKDVESIKFRK